MRSVGLRGVQETRSHPVDVGAAAEGFAGTSEDEDADLRVSIDRRKAGEEGADQVPVQGVAALGAIQGQAGDAAPVGLEQEGLGHERYIRNTPNLVRRLGAPAQMRSACASTSRVRAGSMMPSSQSRAVA